MTSTELLAIYLSASFAIFLLWLGTVGQMLISRRPDRARWAVGATIALALLHPIAAAAAIDLVRLGRSTDEAALRFSPAWMALAGAAGVLGWALALTAWAGVA